MLFRYVILLLVEELPQRSYLKTNPCASRDYVTPVDMPVFLVGSERSGTTLLRLMLDHHPKIAFNGEFEYVVARISNDGEYPEIGRYRKWLKNDRIFQGSRFTVDESLAYAELVNDFLNQKRSRDNKLLVGATVHYEYRKLGIIWPRAKYIYLYRDGRDVAKSVMRTGWAGNVFVAADWWLKAEKEWDALRDALGHDDWIEVRYEDLVASTKPQLEHICTFLGVEYSEKMFDYVKTSTYGPPDASLNYRWKTGMRKRDVQRLEEKLGDRLLGRGYEPSGYPRISVPALTRKYLHLHSRVAAFLFRLGRFGIVLTFQEALSRRFGLKQVHRKAVARINQIVNANLQ